MGLRIEYTSNTTPVNYAPVGVEFGNTDQEYDVDGTTWVNAVSGGALGGIPDETSDGHKLADCLAAVASPIDGTHLAVRENSGAASATNPATVQFLFEDIPKFDHVDVRIQYAGNASHIVCVEAWDYVNSAFVCLQTFSDQSQQTIYSLKVLAASNFISSGNVIIQVIHTSTGNTGHRYDIDYVKIVENG
jgi:hypothetical protein